MLSKEIISREFNRDVWCLFGLPVDNIDMEGIIVELEKRRQYPENTVLSTINVNWVVQSFHDPEFRKAIVNSDLVTLDGRPLLWLAKCLHFPMEDVVPGSSLMQKLHQNNKLNDPFSLFLFGGQEGAGQLAQDRINRVPGGLHAVGFLNPGFGSVEEMSDNKIIETINNKAPDILLVALGALKGTRWIEKNRNRLNAKVVSHLGATINFFAGTVRRAPKLLCTVGLEWVWRIFQEPKLFSRYFNDGLFLLLFLLRHIMLWYQAITRRGIFNQDYAKMKVAQLEKDDEILLFFKGHLNVSKTSSLRKIFCEAVCSRKRIVLDFSKTISADGAFMGQLLLLMKWQHRNACGLVLRNIPAELEKIFNFFSVFHSLSVMKNDGNS